MAFQDVLGVYSQALLFSLLEGRRSSCRACTAENVDQVHEVWEGIQSHPIDLGSACTLAVMLIGFLLGCA